MTSYLAVHLVFLWKLLRLRRTFVTLFCVHFESGGYCGMLAGVYSKSQSSWLIMTSILLIIKKHGIHQLPNKSLSLLVQSACSFFPIFSFFQSTKEVDDDQVRTLDLPALNRCINPQGHWALLFVYLVLLSQSI